MSAVNAMLILGVLMIAAGCWCLIRTYHMLKITIGIEVMVKAVTMFLMLAGRVSGRVALAQSFVITVMLEGGYLSDVPITIAAIDPCYSCTDRMLIDLVADLLYVWADPQMKAHYMAHRAEGGRG